jgi:hypothetical protein
MFYRGALIDRVLFRVAPHIFGDVDELRQPANLALLVTFNVTYPTAPAQSRVHANAHQTF